MEGFNFFFKKIRKKGLKTKVMKKNHFGIRNQIKHTYYRDKTCNIHYLFFCCRVVKISYLTMAHKMCDYEKRASFDGMIFCYPLLLELVLLGRMQE